MGASVFDEFQVAIVDAVEEAKPNIVDPETETVVQDRTTDSEGNS